MSFSTGRPVVNDIQARFCFAGGLIAVPPPLRKKACAQARGQLDEFIASEEDKGPA